MWNARAGSNPGGEEKKPKSLILIEKDYVLSNDLREKFKYFKNIKVFNEDILKFDIEKNIKKKYNCYR